MGKSLPCDDEAKHLELSKSGMWYTDHNKNEQGVSDQRARQVKHVRIVRRRSQILGEFPPEMLHLEMVTVRQGQAHKAREKSSSSGLCGEATRGKAGQASQHTS